jgi:hypothetical protein
MLKCYKYYVVLNTLIAFTLISLIAVYPNNKKGNAKHTENQLRLSNNNPCNSHLLTNCPIVLKSDIRFKMSQFVGFTKRDHADMRIVPAGSSGKILGSFWFLKMTHDSFYQYVKLSDCTNEAKSWGQPQIDKLICIISHFRCSN